MKINWNLRLRNRAWLAALLATIATFLFDLLELLGLKPAIGEDLITTFISALLTLLAAMGVIMDPTTPGVKDSSDVMEEK